jgi:hypothetical protein
MNSKISRRDFLKLAGVVSLGAIIPPSMQHLRTTEMAQGDRCFRFTDRKKHFPIWLSSR